MKAPDNPAGAVTSAMTKANVGGSQTGQSTPDAGKCTGLRLKPAGGPRAPAPRSPRCGSWFCRARRKHCRWRRPVIGDRRGIAANETRRKTQERRGAHLRSWHRRRPAPGFWLVAKGRRVWMLNRPGCRYCRYAFLLLVLSPHRPASCVSRKSSSGVQTPRTCNARGNRFRTACKGCPARTPG